MNGAKTAEEAESVRAAGSDAVREHASTPAGYQEVDEWQECSDEMGDVRTAVWLGNCLREGEARREASLTSQERIAEARLKAERNAELDEEVEEF